MFGLHLREIAKMNGVSLRACGTGEVLVVVPGMEGSGESCLQTIAETLLLLRASMIERRLILVDYSAEKHDSFDELVTTIKLLVGTELGGTTCTLWSQSFGNLLATAVVDAGGGVNIDKCVLVSPFESLPPFRERISVLAGSITPRPLFELTMKPLGRVIFGPVGDQPNHPFFTALARMDPHDFARRTAWMIGRAFAGPYARLAAPCAIFLGARDRLVDLPLQKSFFGDLAHAGGHALEIVAGSGHVALASPVIAALAARIALLLGGGQIADDG